MKYMIMMFGDTGTMMETKSPEWIGKMMTFMQNIDQDLTKSGELVFELGLTDGSTAKLVSLKDGVPVAADGSFAESKESLIGYWVVDVASEARAIDIASQVVEVIDAPVEVRRVMDAPPET